MNELVILKENKAVTTSLKVAESFGKKHRNVMQSIKNLTAENSAVKKMFAQSTYVNSRGQEWPMYYMSRDGFSLLVMGFTGHWHYYTSAVKLLEANALEIKEYEENHIEED